MSKNLPYATSASIPSFRLHSSSFNDGATLPPAQTSARFGVAGGKDESPQLSWGPVPEGTKSLAVTVFDPDAPGGGFWHWAAAGIPAGTGSLAAGAGSPDGGMLPAGAFQLKNDAGFSGYLGAAPPRGHGPHRYVVAVHALDVADLGLGAGAPSSKLGPKLDQHTLGRAVITGRFER
ncbi:YbhB/YbcL family Raf kinase inhibitor-like protein [Arthrobacter cavernae]|uniref:YbhB/YbcL family Raf kinase inhibitor-like protein n=1 Tax=Arthrobacter cavernae TaxID=2817681 RepID=A0A939KIV3_9MICC|nr:YbhB/YbcL family Raf kinase inhibitor-like protein [Arthrobacter cavernae]MBO1268017.1 YbhB/YbcL family Raf kinase inhibitor-like protein [Arthrobacter cavernae]